MGAMEKQLAPFKEAEEGQTPLSQRVGEVLEKRVKDRAKEVSDAPAQVEKAQGKIQQHFAKKKAAIKTSSTETKNAAEDAVAPVAPLSERLGKVLQKQVEDR